MAMSRCVIRLIRSQWPLLCGSMPASLPQVTGYDSLSLDRVGECSCQWDNQQRARHLQSLRGCRAARRCALSARNSARCDAAHNCVNSCSATSAISSDERGLSLAIAETSFWRAAVAAVAPVSNPGPAAVRQPPQSIRQILHDDSMISILLPCNASPFAYHLTTQSWLFSALVSSAQRFLTE